MCRTERRTDRNAIAINKYCALATLHSLYYSWNSTGPTPTLGMRLSCNFVNVYTITCRAQYTCTCVGLHARIPNGHPRKENRACRTSRRGSSCVFGSWRTKLYIPVASWTGKSPNTPTSSRRSSRGSRRGCPCPCPCRRRGMPALCHTAECRRYKTRFRSVERCELTLGSSCNTTTDECEIKCRSCHVTRPSF